MKKGALPQQITLLLYIQPGAKKTEVSGEYDERIRIRLQAPPVDGKANAKLIEFLADAFEVKRSEVFLKFGEKSRYKTLEIFNPQTLPKWYIDEI